MNIETLREYCLSKPFAEECFPFDAVTLVFKVGGKIFALVALDEALCVNLKCDPEKALELREEYPAVQPGYHMNKTLWNTVHIDGSVSDNLLKRWIDHSYEEVVKAFSKKKREEIQKTIHPRGQ
jgi:predicted DNA-binding protein (MmcQ/YjbR family)